MPPILCRYANDSDEQSSSVTENYDSEEHTMRGSAGFLLCSLLLLLALHGTEVAAQDDQPDPKMSCANWMGGAPGHPGHNGLPGRDGKDGKDGQKGDKGEPGW
ncbi:UNVERIFIED_CONTAM: hypothetical protein H355_006361 [Colinus virginianus]|nr:hypothetical protein H355_006361 [Colinus virginianus]